MPGGSIQNENVEVGPLCMYARHITNENSVDDPYPELLDARELGDGDGGRVAASHGAHLDVHLEVDSTLKEKWSGIKDFTLLGQ